MYINLKLYRVLLCLWLGISVGYAKNGCEAEGQNTAFLKRIGCPEDFKMLKGSPLSNKYSNISSVKVVYDLQSKDVYFINSFYYKFHYEFCLAEFQAYPGLAEFNAVEYSSDTSRRYGLANINYFEGKKEYCMELFADDELPTPKLLEMFRDIQAKVCFGHKLSLFMNSTTMLRRKKQVLEAKIPMIYPDDVFKTQTFQAMNKGVAYGYLKVVDSKDFKKEEIKTNDIIVSKGLPNELPLCRAIVTSTFQTPLCHINILSNNRGTPNAAWKNVLADAQIMRLKNKLVRLEVLDNSISLKEADLPTAEKAWASAKPKKNINVKANLDRKNLVDADKLRMADVAFVGGKAANFGEMTRIRVWKKPLPMPEGAFAIPFYFYEQYINSNDIGPLISELLNSKPQDAVILEKKLKEIRRKIKEGKVSDTLIQQIKAKMKANGKWEHYRFRSSTNAEDVSGFNGAGLYNSKTGSLSDTSKPIDKALKTVWASLWNLRAFQEREFFNIDHKKVYMGILCHRSFGEEAVNGVVITRNLYRANYPGIVINAQKGEHSVVLPEDSMGCEQILITMPLGNDDNLDKIGIDHITFSGFSPQKSLMSKAELILLVRYSRAIKSHFYLKKHPIYEYVSFEKFAMDIEFKLDRTTRQLYIKQARQYD